LKGIAVAAGAASIAAASPASRKREDPSVQELAEAHANDPALLIDLTKCVGCGKCAQACKTDNQLEWREDQPAKGPNAALASSNWTVVRSEGRVGDDGESRFVKQQCMHCLEPACVSACFVRALEKTESGAVVYDGDRCVGCRYCQMACPFSVPTFEWDETFGRISKCDFCVERTSKGEPTACSEVCPRGALTFGKRDEMIAEAHRRIGAMPETYVPHIYGETEVGGTSVLYISDVDFELLGFRTTLPDTPLPEYTWEITRLIPPVATGILGTLLALYIRRRRAIMEMEDAAAAADAHAEVTA
jgi:formate dehydrogenase iron-sulfur subunit